MTTPIKPRDPAPTFASPRNQKLQDAAATATEAVEFGPGIMDQGFGEQQQNHEAGAADDTYLLAQTTELFNSLDKDGSGMLDKEELAAAMPQLLDHARGDVMKVAEEKFAAAILDDRQVQMHLAVLLVRLPEHVMTGAAAAV